MGSLIKRIQNIVSEDYQNEIEEYFNSDSIPWIKNPKSESIRLYNYRYQYHFGYADNILDPKASKFVKDIVQSFEKKTNIEIEKIKTTLVQRLDKSITLDNEFKKTIHTDIKPYQFDFKVTDNHLTIIYYINNSDGDLSAVNSYYHVIESYTPQKGSVCYFDSRILHGATNPIINETRMSLFIGTIIKK